MQQPIREFLRWGVRDHADWMRQAEALRDGVERAEGSLALAKAMGALGEHLRLSAGHREGAITLLQDALRRAEDAGEIGTIALTRIRLAVAHQYADNHKQAIALHRSAIELIGENNVPGLLDFALQHMGKCHAELGEFAEAAACFEHALRLREQRGDQDLINSTREAVAHLQCLQRHCASSEPRSDVDR